MADVKYVCLSDLHLGEEDSLLTKLVERGRDDFCIEPEEASPVMLCLIDCLKALIGQNTEPPTLILAGDILELALAATHEAAMVFERFCELILGDEPLAKRIVYIPGNHDHHIWELAREAQYVEYVIKGRTESRIAEPHHNTKMFETKPLTSNLLISLLTTNMKIEKLPDFGLPFLQLAYPNYTIPDKPGQKCVIFHHGHFIEPIYHLMSDLRDLLYRDHQRPVRIWEVEGENFAWIDFFWSQLGRSGQAGAGIERAYEKMKDRDRFDELLRWVAGNAARKHDFLWPRRLKRPGAGLLIDCIEECLLKLAFKLVPKVLKLPERHRKEPEAGRRNPTIAAIKRVLHSLGGLGSAVMRALGLMEEERPKSGLPLSDSAFDGLRKYVSGPLREQILEEIDAVWGDIPFETTFVFGHTHKPFEEFATCEEYAHRLKLYNTGGWVVDEPEPNEQHGGSIILIDESLNVVSVRMYNEREQADDYRVSVTEISSGAAKSAFCTAIERLVNPDADPWKSFSVTVASEIEKRRAFLRQKIAQRPGRCKP
jgi:hypothetical protein